MTNYEKIKNMSIEEMTEMLRKAACSRLCEHQEYCDMNSFPFVKSEICNGIWREWLESEAENE